MMFKLFAPIILILVGIDSYVRIIMLLCSFVYVYYLVNGIGYKKTLKQEKLIRKKYNSTWSKRYVKYLMWCDYTYQESYGVPLSRSKESKSLFFKARVFLYNFTKFNERLNKSYIVRTLSFSKYKVD